MNGDRRARFIVSGVVQGVCFRMYARDEALRLSLTGWVRNRSDGTVEVLAEGRGESVRQLYEWCLGGPPMAHVTDVEATYAEPTGEFSSFRISY